MQRVSCSFERLEWSMALSGWVKHLPSLTLYICFRQFPPTMYSRPPCVLQLLTSFCFLFSCYRQRPYPVIHSAQRTRYLQLREQLAVHCKNAGLPPLPPTDFTLPLGLRPWHKATNLSSFLPIWIVPIFFFLLFFVASSLFQCLVYGWQDFFCAWYGNALDKRPFPLLCKFKM